VELKKKELEADDERKKEEERVKEDLREEEKSKKNKNKKVKNKEDCFEKHQITNRELDSLDQANNWKKTK
jgi:hypothetical protein